MKETAVSIVVPVFNEEESVAPLHSEITGVMAGLGAKYEVIFVNDGSSDGTKHALDGLDDVGGVLRVIHLPEHSGKSVAMSRGFRESGSPIIITLDGDLQDDPSEIPRFLEKMGEGYDLVVGWKYVRKDPMSKRLPSKVFNFLTGAISGLFIHDFNCGFKAYKMEVAMSVVGVGTLFRYIPALAHLDGYRVTEIPVNHRPRKFGKSKYGAARIFIGLKDLFKLALIAAKKRIT